MLRRQTLTTSCCIDRAIEDNQEKIALSWGPPCTLEPGTVHYPDSGCRVRVFAIR